MSITIHHGSNGSYKTSGVIQDYFVPAAKDGRVVVTNIRGVSRENTMMKMDDVPDSFDVIFIDTDTKEGRWKIATWFHWVPLGALLLFDEAGVMFPKAWRQSDIDKLDFPGGVDAAQNDGRPANWVEAWEMHRHFNWDIVLSCPNIKSVRGDIRETTEGAYKHKNKALLGPLFKGYKEGYHDAQKNGQSASDFDVIRDKRITDLSFALYESTKTGVFKGTLNGFNLFTSPRVLLALGVAVCAFSYAILSGGYDVLTGKNLPGQQVAETSEVPEDSVSGAVGVSDQAVPGPVKADSYEGLAQAFDNASVDVVAGQSNDSDLLMFGVMASGPLSGRALQISAGVKASGRFIYAFKLERSQRLLSVSDLEVMGYRVEGVDPCNALITYQDQDVSVGCFSFDEFAGSVTRGATDGARRGIDSAINI